MTDILSDAQLDTALASWVDWAQRCCVDQCTKATILSRIEEMFVLVDASVRPGRTERRTTIVQGLSLTAQLAMAKGLVAEEQRAILLLCNWNRDLSMEDRFEFLKRSLKRLQELDLSGHFYGEPMFMLLITGAPLGRFDEIEWVVLPLLDGLGPSSSSFVATQLLGGVTLGVCGRVDEARQVLESALTSGRLGVVGKIEAEDALRRLAIGPDELRGWGRTARNYKKNPT